MSVIKRLLLLVWILSTSLVTYGQSGNCTYTVQPGDTLFAIALSYNVTLDAMFAVNPGLNGQGDLIHSGLVLEIPGCVPRVGAANLLSGNLDVQPTPELPTAIPTAVPTATPISVDINVDYAQINLGEQKLFIGLVMSRPAAIDRLRIEFMDTGTGLLLRDPDEVLPAERVNVSLRGMIATQYEMRVTALDLVNTPIAHAKYAFIFAPPTPTPSPTPLVVSAILGQPRADEKGSGYIFPVETTNQDIIIRYKVDIINSNNVVVGGGIVDAPPYDSVRVDMGALPAGEYTISLRPLDANNQPLATSSVVALRYTPKIPTTIFVEPTSVPATSASTSNTQTTTQPSAQNALAPLNISLPQITVPENFAQLVIMGAGVLAAVLFLFISLRLLTRARQPRPMMMPLAQPAMQPQFGSQHLLNRPAPRVEAPPYKGPETRIEPRGAPPPATLDPKLSRRTEIARVKSKEQEDSNYYEPVSRPSPTGEMIYGELIIKRGLEGVRSIPIDREKFIIGRELAVGCDYAIPERSLSASHSTIFYSNGSFQIMDNKSSNGTYLDGERLKAYKKYPLPANAIIRLSNRIEMVLKPANSARKTLEEPLLSTGEYSTRVYDNQAGFEDIPKTEPIRPTTEQFPQSEPINHATDPFPRAETVRRTDEIDLFEDSHAYEIEDDYTDNIEAQDSSRLPAVGLRRLTDSAEFRFSDDSGDFSTIRSASPTQSNAEGDFYGGTSRPKYANGNGNGHSTQERRGGAYATGQFFGPDDDDSGENEI